MYWKYTIITLLVAVVISCKEQVTVRSNVTHDTIMLGRPKNYENFSLAKRAFPVLTFKYADGSYIKAKVENGQFFFQIEPDKALSLKMIGFKDSSLFYPMAIRSKEIRIDSGSKDTGYYKLSLLKDTAKVDCMLDCSYWWVNVWENSGDEKARPIIRECKDSLHIATVRFVKTVPR